MSLTVVVATLLLWLAALVSCTSTELVLRAEVLPKPAVTRKKRLATITSERPPHRNRLRGTKLQ